MALPLTMPDLRLAEVAHFLLIVRDTSVALVINWARKLEDGKVLSRAGGDGGGQSRWSSDEKRFESCKGASVPQF